MVNVFAWITIAAGVSIIIPQILLAMVSHYDPAYVPHSWHFFLLYQAMNVLCLLYNIFAVRHTMWVFNVGCRHPKSHIYCFD
jgi:choline transport protein